MNLQFLKGSLSGAVATLVDFLGFHAGLLLFPSPVPSVVLGAVLGGLTNFELNRSWTFEGRASVGRAAPRYLLASGGSALLSAGLVWGLARLGSLPPSLLWAVSRVLCFFFVTWPLFRFWVYRESTPPAVIPVSHSEGDAGRSLWRRSGS